MAEKMIKNLLFTYGKAVPNPLFDEEHTPDQPKMVIIEGLGRMGEVVDITRQYDLNRGEENDAFFTDEERKAIEAGTYSGPLAEVVMSARANTATGTPTVTAVPGATGGVVAVGEVAVDISAMPAEQISELIQDQKLNVEDTIAMAGDDPDLIEKVMDAEEMLPNGGRKTVVDKLDKKLAELSTGGENEGEE
jgi:hypothetical protein